MNSVYPNSGMQLKKAVRVLNILGYAVSDLLGLAAGVYVAYYLYFFTLKSPWLIAVAAIASAVIVAIPLLFGTWFSGLVLWNISDANDYSRANLELACQFEE